MSDGDALLSAILANPAEDTPRLMYADWLQENGQGKRAEFIRLGIHAYRNSKSQHHRRRGVGNRFGPRFCKRACPRCHYLSECRRCSFLLGGNPTDPATPTWHLTGLPPNKFETVRFDRGFVYYCYCAAADWLTHGDAICAQHPVTSVDLTTAPELHCPYYDHGDVFFELAALAGGEHVVTRPFSSLIGPPQEVDYASAPDVVIELLNLHWPRIHFHIRRPLCH